MDSRLEITRLIVPGCVSKYAILYFNPQDILVPILLPNPRTSMHAKEQHK